MNDRSGTRDGLIDEALGALTQGAPAADVRRRVLARIAAADGTSPGRHIEVFSWRARPVRAATVLVAAVIALTGTLIVSGLIGRSPGATTETAAVSSPVSPVSHGSAASDSRTPVVEHATTVNAAERRRPSTAPIPRDSPAAPPAAALDEATPIQTGGIVPLPDPQPIADRPIEITPLVIQPVANREIHIPLIETSRPLTGPGQSDKR